MNNASARHAILAWLFLVTATLCSGWLAEHHGLAGRWTAAAVILVAAIKAHVVMTYFMELDQTSIRWRLAFGTWTVVFSSLIVVIYFLSLPN